MEKYFHLFLKFYGNFHIFNKSYILADCYTRKQIHHFFLTKSALRMQCVQTEVICTFWPVFRYPVEEAGNGENCNHWLMTSITACASTVKKKKAVTQLLIHSLQPCLPRAYRRQRRNMD
jgi:hypothetical protein